MFVVIASASFENVVCEMASICLGPNVLTRQFHSLYIEMHIAWWQP